MGVRRAHLVGSIPAATAADAMRLAAMDQVSQDRPRFQIGIPGDVDLAMFTFGPSGPVRHLRPFTEALAIVMHQTSKLFGDDALFQIEVPVARRAGSCSPSRGRSL